jgi:hypothetical protein
MVWFTMKVAHSRLAYGLAFAGALPFMAAIGLVAFNWQADRAITFALTYGAVIIAFLSGIHWAVFLFRPVECPQNLFVISNVTALIGWFAIALPSWLCFLVQSACFVSGVFRPRRAVGSPVSMPTATVRRVGSAGGRLRSG